MKKSRILTTMLALGLVAALGAPTAFAWRHRGDYEGRGRGGPGCPYFETLTDEQQTAVQAIFAEHNKAVSPLRKQLAAKQAELDALYYADNKDNAKIQALFREMADIEAKLYTADADLKAKLAGQGIDDWSCRGGYGRGHRGRHGGYGGHGGGHGGRNHW